MVSRDRLVVRTLRCGRSNPGSNPGPGMSFFELLSSLFCQGFFVNFRLFSSFNYEFSETLPRDIILLRVLGGNYSSNFIILGAPIKVRY